MSTWEEQTIYETEYFQLCVPNLPHVTRKEGGHVFIRCKRKIKDRTELTRKEALEFIEFSIVVADAYTEMMNEQGIEIAKVNYQENGNWAYLRNEEPEFHLNIYGRTKTAKLQPFGENLDLPNFRTGFYDDNEKLNEEDIQILIQKLDELWR